MSAIFLSHSSKDSERAATLKRWLDAQGHSVFLDCDPGDGIVGGAHWERTLYERLHVCQAVIPLLSPHWMESKWCFAELIHARACGKAILPVRIMEGERQPLFANIQEIDLTHDLESGYQRLQRALHEVFPWDAKRPPYPGLATYTEDDAPVFFGREPEITAGLEQLESLRRRGRSAPRLLLVLGASGSGKSSLVRAGWIPRLRRSEREWIVVPAFRPRAAPIDELAVSLSASYVESGHARPWEDITRAFMATDRTEGNADSVLLDITRDLRACFKRPDATVLLTIDQVEELFTASDSARAAACLTALRNALDRSDAELIVVATMRSDFLGVFQRHRFLQESSASQPLAYDRLTVDPMPASRLDAVIRGPADRAGIKIDDDLVERLTADTRTVALGEYDGAAGNTTPTHSADALPLLAFTLRRLWDTEEYRKDGRLELREYKDLGGVAGAIVKVVNETLNLSAASVDELRALRAAFIPGLVRVTADGVRTRRRALLTSMPREAQGVLKKLVDARLLMTDQDRNGNETIEAAHEALFRMWPQLARWLDEDQDKLRLIEGIHQAAREWQQAGEREDLLVHRDVRLAEALALLRDERDPRFRKSLDAVGERYLRACDEAQQRRATAARAEQERQIRDATTIVRRTRMGLAAAAALAGLLFVAYRVARRNETIAQDQSRLVLASHLGDHDPTRAGLVLQELARPLALFNVRSAAYDVLAHPLARAELRHRGPVRWVDVTRDGQLILTASSDSTAAIWDAAIGVSLARLPHNAEVLRALFSPDQQHIVTTAMDRTLRVWGRDGEAITPNLEHEAVVSDIAFDSAGDRIVTGSFRGVVRVWPVGAASPPLVLNPNGSAFEVLTVAFDASGRRVLAAFGDNVIRVWRVDGQHNDNAAACALRRPIVTAAFSVGDGSVLIVTRDGTLYGWRPLAGRRPEGCAPQALIRGSVEAKVTHASFSPANAQLAMLETDGSIKVWRAPFGTDSATLTGGNTLARHGFFTGNGDGFVAGYADGSARVWRRDAPKTPRILAGHDGPVLHVAASRDANLVVTASDDGTARVWSLGDSAAPGERFFYPLVHARNVSAVDVSPDGATVLTGGLNSEVHLWRLDGTRIRKFADNTAIRHAEFSPTGNKVLWVANDGDVRVRGAGQNRETLLLRDEQESDKAVYASFSPEGRRVVTASDNGSARIWNTSAKAPPIRLRGHAPGMPLIVALFNPAGDLVMTASADGTTRLWYADREAAAKSVFAHPGGVTVRSASFSPNGKLLVTAGDDGVARVWRVGRNDTVPAFTHQHGSPLRSAAFSPDTRRLVTGGEDGVARIWQAESQAPSIPLVGHRARAPIVSAEFSPDGRLVLTASKDGTARLWNADGSDDPVVFDWHTQALVRAIFTPAGDRIVTASSDRRAIIWSIAPRELLAVIRARTRLCLRPEFRMRYLLETQSQALPVYQACEAAHQKAPA